MALTRRELLIASGLTAAGAVVAPSIVHPQAPKRGGTLSLRLWDPPHFDLHAGGGLSYKLHTMMTFTHSRLVRHKVGPSLVPGTFQIEPDLAELPARLSEALPVGIEVSAAAAIDDRAPSLQEAVSSCGWRLGISGAGHDELCEKVAGVIAAPSLVVTRKRKGKVVTDDIRPGILALRVVEGVEVECELAAQPRAVRPGELVRAIDPGLEEAWVRRTNQWIERDGARGVPLHATDAQHVRLAGARAR